MILLFQQSFLDYFSFYNPACVAERMLFRTPGNLTLDEVERSLCKKSKNKLKFFEKFFDFVKMEPIIS